MPRGTGALAPYGAVLRVRSIRNATIVGLLSRVPQFGMGVLLTLHIVQHLDHRYSRAGLVSGAFVVAATIAGPWRGHRLDQVGLRRAMVPSLLVVGACVAVGPLCSYWQLFALMVPMGLMSPPTFSVMRQVMVANSPDELRATAMSLDSVAVELGYMVGPTLAVWVVTLIDTRVALWLFGGLWVLGAGLLTWLDPRIAVTDAAPDPEADPAALPAAEQAALDLSRAAGARSASPRSWLTPGIAALLVSLLGAGFVLGGTELAIVAALRAGGHGDQIGWQLAIWGFGSAIGGILNGALQRQLPVFVLLGLLGLTAIPVAWAGGTMTFAALLFVNGLFCAPTLATSAEVLSRQVDAGFLGQVMGWHGSAVNAGSAIAPSVVGGLMDAVGWRSGFVVSGLFAALAAGVLVAAQAVRRRSASSPRME